MTPKEKAFELITKFQHPISEKSDTECLHIEVAKEFALIAVNEMIQATNMYQFRMDGMPSRIVAHPYWQEVKQEIENL